MLYRMERDEADLVMRSIFRHEAQQQLKLCSTLVSAVTPSA